MDGEDFGVNILGGMITGAAGAIGVIGMLWILAKMSRGDV